MSEPRRKTLRSFYCEEPLWQAFDKLARERELTIDQLLNDAMRRWLEAGASAAPSAPAMSGPTTALPRLAPPAAPAAPAYAPAAAPAAPAYAPAPVAPAPAAPAPAAPAAVQLFVRYDGNVVPITKDHFIIGRGAKEADLVIRDQNVSRRHAQVVFHQGQYFIQDLGSTNGIEFRGARVDTKRIDEGDVFVMCEHQISFSYRA